MAGGGEVPTVPDIGACRCGARIRWVQLAGGAEIPADSRLERDAPLVPRILNDGRRVAVKRGPHDSDRPGFVPHWDTCPDPGRWAELRAAVSAGLPAGRPMERSAAAASRGDASLGPCAGCYRPDHIAYGPQCAGTLCEGCAAILAAWRALSEDARCRTRLVYPRWKKGARR